MSLRFQNEPREDKRLRQMIVVSAVLHIAVILWIVINTSRFSLQPRAVAYTVELVNPAALGTNIPGGRQERSSDGDRFRRSAKSAVSVQARSKTAASG